MRRLLRGTSNSILNNAILIYKNRNSEL